MGASESGKDKVSIRGGATTTVVPVAAGAGDSNIAGGIIQLHWELILERCLDMNQHVRLSALKVEHASILRQCPCVRLFPSSSLPVSLICI